MSDVSDVSRDTSQTLVSDHVSDRVDLSTWLTKPQAAAAIGVSTKAIERFTQAGKLEQRLRPQAHGPKVAVYFPDDVAKLAQERQPGATPFVLPAGSDITNGNGKASSLPNIATSDISHRLSAGSDPLRAFAAAVVAAVMSQTSQTSSAPMSQTLFLTLPEASSFTGLTQGYLRRAIAEGRLPAVKSPGWRIRRRDLEAL